MSRVQRWLLESSKRARREIRILRLRIAEKYPNIFREYGYADTRRIPGDVEKKERKEEKLMNERWLCLTSA